MLAVGSVFKQIPVVLIPTYAILSYKEYGSYKIAIRYLVLAVSVFSVLTLTPMFLFGWPLDGMYNALSYGVGATTSPYEGVSSFPVGAASPFNLFLLLDRVLPNSDLKVPPALAYLWIPSCFMVYVYTMRNVKKVDLASTIQYSFLTMLVFFTTRTWVSEPNLIFLFILFLTSLHLPIDIVSRARVLLEDLVNYRSIHLMWILLFVFVMANVPLISFFWILSPEALNVASAFADGPLGWTRLLLMSCSTFSWLALGWYQMIKVLRRGQ